MIVLDTHLDTPTRFDDGRWDFAERHRYDWDGSQVDLPRMAEGGLDGGFFVIYTRQGELTPAGYAEARDAALVRAAAIHRVIGENRGSMGLALTAADAERLHREGKRIAFLSIENSWPLGEDLSPSLHLPPARRANGRAGAQPHQPVRRFGHRRGALERPQPARPAMGCGDEPARHGDRRQPQLRRCLRPDARAVAGFRSSSPIPGRGRSSSIAAISTTRGCGGLPGPAGVMFINSIFLVAHDTSDARTRSRNGRRAGTC